MPYPKDYPFSRRCSNDARVAPSCSHRWTSIQDEELLNKNIGASDVSVNCFHGPLMPSTLGGVSRR